jgi:predicted amidohydrolase
MQNLNISYVQLDTAWQDISANLSRLTEILKALNPETDLLVLPEMFSTGFTMTPETCAEKMEGSAVRWMQGQATLRNMTVAGSLVIEDEGKYYNRFVFVHANGKLDYYNKRHLFSLSGEHEKYTQGNQNITIDIQGWKVRPQICYDLRFPVWSKNRDEYDLLLYSANWPEKRIEHWRKLLMARAIENQAYTMGINRVGTDGNDLTFNGSSMLVSPMGDVLHESDNKEVLEMVSLDKQKIAEFRDFLSVLKDADSFSID